jgi:pyruvate/2-oxoglutarate dehydrogenase complex dihydrolipoamide dehydrogenase (E3) component
MHAGLELAQCMARFGSRVTVFAKSGDILGKEDRDAAALLYKQLQADGVEFRMEARYHMVQSGGPEGQEIHVQLLGLHKDQAKVMLLQGHQVKACMSTNRKCMNQQPYCEAFCASHPTVAGVWCDL